MSILDNIKRKASAKALGVSDKEMAQMEDMQKTMTAFQYRHEEGGIVVKLSGDGKVQWLEVNGEDREDIKSVINKAHDKMQKELAKKMMESGGLGGLLGRR